MSASCCGFSVSRWSASRVSALPTVPSSTSSSIGRRPAASTPASDTDKVEYFTSSGELADYCDCLPWLHTHRPSQSPSVKVTPEKSDDEEKVATHLTYCNLHLGYWCDCPVYIKQIKKVKVTEKKGVKTFTGSTSSKPADFVAAMLAEASAEGFEVGKPEQEVVVAPGAPQLKTRVLPSRGSTKRALSTIQSPKPKTKAQKAAGRLADVLEIGGDSDEEDKPKKPKNRRIQISDDEDEVVDVSKGAIDEKQRTKADLKKVKDQSRHVNSWLPFCTCPCAKWDCLIQFHFIGCPFQTAIDALPSRDR